MCINISAIKFAEYCYSEEMKKYLKLPLLILGLLLLFIFISNIIVFTTTKSFIYDDASRAPKAKVALVPGAAVSKTGLLSPIFIDRLDMAAALYKAKKVTKILVSGDNSTDDYNEVNPARLYLITKDVSDIDIYLDHAGFDTYSSMYRARDIFKVTSIIVSTQSFHLPRAIFIARLLGMMLME